jgi:cation-transporting ATPase F
VAFLRQFNQPLVYILLMAGLVALAAGEVVDSAVILGVVMANDLIGLLQEAKAGRAIDALARMVATERAVRREGRLQQINAEHLVPGDIVLLNAGDKVPADLRLVETRSLRVDESALTGESKAISGGEWERIADDTPPQVAEETVVFARMTPEQKFRLVTALQRRGHDG